VAYIGREPTNTGEFLLIDDISGDFNGSTTSFTLKVGRTEVTPAAANTIIALDGVLQNPSSSYSISGSTVTFTGAPDSGLDFYGVLSGQSQYISNNSITDDHISETANISGSKINTNFAGQNIVATHITASGNISASGIVIADTFQSTGGSVDGISFTDDLNITGNITASGDISGSGNIFGTGNLDIDGTSNLEGDVTLQNDLTVTGNITGSGNISGSHTSTGSFGHVSVDELTIPSLSQFSSSIATQLNTLTADVIALSIALG
jgi:cytoskeletal protein CcmA (bactofilin family)